MKRYTATVFSNRSQRGFTLMETMVSMLIMAFIMLGTMDLYINSLRMASRSTAEVFASQDAAVAMRSIENQIRQSLWLALPDTNDAYDTTVSPSQLYFSEALTQFPSLSGYSASSFIATDPTHTYTADTALFLAFPSVDNTPMFYTSAAVQSNGQSTSAPYNMYNRNNAYSGGYLIYRANANGTPNPSSGQYLWEVSTGANPTTNRWLIQSVDTTTWNAVQFDRPIQAGNTAFHYEVEMKITSGYYSAINGQQTNESTNGTSTTQLVGRCVTMRDHELNGTHYPSAVYPTSVQVGNKFQATTGPG